MRIVDFTLKVLGITEAMHRWHITVADVDDRRRDKIARYAEEIAATLARIAEAIERLDRDPADKAAARIAVREFGRLSGYIETIVTALEGRVDGRRLAGVKRRLEGLADDGPITATVRRPDTSHIERLAAAEGYFRALADSLRI